MSWDDEQHVSLPATEASVSDSGSTSRTRAMSEPAAESSGTSTSASASHLPANHTNGKPVVLRVKRKVSQSRLGAFWLEINERPTKRPLLDLTSLSISEPLVGNVVEKIGTKKLLVQHLETVGCAEDVKDVLHSFLHESSCSQLKRKAEERWNFLKHDNKQKKLHSMARKEHEDLIRNARFEQIWKSRRKSGDADEDSLLEICHLYDVVQFGSENEINVETPKPNAAPLDDNAILCNYLPLIREYLPSAAVEIESDIAKSGEEDYVYDLYAVDDDLSIKVEETNAYPLVLVDDDDDLYDGPVGSDYDTDDSNAEDNPLNDYPDEESSEDGDGDKELLAESEGSDSEYENEEVIVDEEDDQDWKWGYR